MNPLVALRGALLMVIVGAALGLAFNALNPDPLPWKTVPRKAVSLDELQAGSPTGAEATPAEAETPEPVPKTEAETPEPEPEADADPGPVTEAPPADPAPEPVAADPEASDPVATDPVAADYADVPESEFPIEIPLERAWEFYERGGLRVLDAREHEEYVTGHIAGAELAPFDEKAGDVEWMDAVAADPRPVLVYCDGTDCEVSLNLGFEITQSGHRRVLVLAGGFSGWAEAGHPVTTGETP